MRPGAISANCCVTMPMTYVCGGVRYTIRHTQGNPMHMVIEQQPPQATFDSKTGNNAWRGWRHQLGTSCLGKHRQSSAPSRCEVLSHLPCRKYVDNTCTRGLAPHRTAPTYCCGDPSGKLSPQWPHGHAQVCVEHHSIAALGVVI